MWAGKYFKLSRDLHAIERVGEKELSSVVPLGETVEVLDGPTTEPNRIKVGEQRWLSRKFVEFAPRSMW